MTGDENHATLTLRFIRSFEQRNIKHIVFKKVDLNQTAQQFLDQILQDLQTRPGIPPPVRKYSYDTLKIQHKAHGAKTSDPIINTESDTMIDLQLSLAANGVETETEISCFRLIDYTSYKKNPKTIW